MGIRPTVVVWAAALAVGVAAADRLLVAQGTERPRQDRLALLNASVVDVRTGAVTSGVTVAIADGRIVSVGREAAPPGVTMIDLAGRHVVPGLVDAHVHIASLAQMRAALESGVTTVRSAGVSHFVDVGLRELVKSGALAGPDVLAAGYHVRPSPAPEAFLDTPNLAGLMTGVTTVDGLRRFVGANLARGVDWIKVLATERAGTPETDPRRQVYTEEELRAVVEEASTRQVPVLAHAHGAEGALAAVRAGVRSIEHGTYLTDEALQLMAKRGTYFVPTVDIVGDLAQPGGDYDNAGLMRRGEMMRPVLMRAVQRAAALGVKVVAGSDTGYGPSSVARVSREALRLTEAGLTPLQALKAATSTAAEMLGLERRIGSVEAGFEADLLVVDANPVEDIRALLDPLLVVTNGRIGVNRLTFGR